MTHTMLSGWLDALDSHGIYPAELLKEIPGVTVTFDHLPGPSHKPVAILHRGNHSSAPVRVALQTLGQMAADPGPAGIRLNPDRDISELSFAGFYLASCLAMLFLGISPGSAKLGRGSAFRADVEAIRAAGL